jgi:probable F420-dependent oxidoreductase
VTKNKDFSVGAVFPQTEIGTDPIEIRDYAQGVEELGFGHLIAYDHVIGADLANRPDWKMPYNVDSTFHEPLVLFAYLAGLTKTLGLTTGVVVVPQRQTVLFAKQAANLDIFTGGRLRLGMGVGWNKVEYDALGQRFDKRGARLDEQVSLLRRLWTERSLSDRGESHHIDEAGICPLPTQRPIPLWIGGFSGPAMKRAAAVGDGWLPFLPANLAMEKAQEFRQAVTEAGRNPDDVPFENIVLLALYSKPRRTVDQFLADVEIWKQAGASAVSIDAMGMNLRGATQHLEFLREVARRLNLK